jgi:hypothetical protein
MAPDQITEFNAVVREWGSATKQQILFRMASLGLTARSSVIHYLKSGRVTGKSLMASLKVSYKDNYGITERVTFSYNYYELFLKTGTGRGQRYGMAGKRRKVDILKPVLEQHIQRLADQVASQFADEAVRRIKAETLTLNITPNE